MKLVRATQADLPEVVSLMNRAYRGGKGWAAEGPYIQGDRISLKDLEAELAAKPDMQLLIWRDTDTLTGCVTLEPLGDGVRWYLGGLTIEPARQEAKLGRRLLAQAEEVARAAGARRMRLNVIWVREALIEWYLRRGYEPTGERTPFPYDDDRWGRPTRPDLAFLWFEKPL